MLTTSAQTATYSAVYTTLHLMKHAARQTAHTTISTAEFAVNFLIPVAAAGITSALWYGGKAVVSGVSSATSYFWTSSESDAQTKDSKAEEVVTPAPALKPSLSDID